MQAMVGSQIQAKLLEVSPPIQRFKGRLAVGQRAARR